MKIITSGPRGLAAPGFWWPSEADRQRQHAALDAKVEELKRLTQQSVGARQAQTLGGKRGRVGATLASEIYPARAQAAVRAGGAALPTLRAPECATQCQHENLDGFPSCQSTGGCKSLIGDHRRLSTNRGGRS